MSQHEELTASQHCLDDLVGIIRRAPEMEQALEKPAALRVRVRRAAVEGHRQFNPGRHLALDLRNMPHPAQPSSSTTASVVPVSPRRGKIFSTLLRWASASVSVTASVATVTWHPCFDVEGAQVALQGCLSIFQPGTATVLLVTRPAI